MCRLTAVALALRQPAAGPATQGRRRSASRCTGEFTVPAISGRMNTSAEAVCRRRGQLVRGGAGTWCSSQDTSVLTARSSCWKSRRRDHGFTGVSRHEVAALVAVDCQTGQTGIWVASGIQVGRDPAGTSGHGSLQGTVYVSALGEQIGSNRHFLHRNQRYPS